MPTTRPKVPGWHPDPDDPSSIRHWDGKRWGHERRPRPSWAPLPRSGSLGDGPGTPPAAGGGSNRRWYLLAGAALVLAIAMVSLPLWLTSGTEPPQRTIQDDAFVEQADAACADALPAIKKSRPKSKEDTGTPAAFAARIDAAAGSLGDLVAKLRAIPVPEADRAHVEPWLTDWDEYIDVGHRYADAVRTGNREQRAQLDTKSRLLERRIFLFAKGNDMPNCFQLSQSDPGAGQPPI
ncbi:MAG TPA: DUF2510 domain-containing protein [Acidimicrobiales bacterium]|nr:DUF2510 domain-containing protein [Acidimicrobiales bacterium]